jgi:hypothetical protein
LLLCKELLPCGAISSNSAAAAFISLIWLVYYDHNAGLHALDDTLIDA